MRCAILDRWGGAFRIVYGCACVSDGSADCRQCPLYKLVGTDPPGVDPESFVTTLVPASPAARAAFPAKQTMLNCKTLAQYLECSVTWIVEHCHTRDEITRELIMVKDFRILFLEGVTDLASKEWEYKRLIVRESLVRIGPGGGRAALVATIAGRLGLLAPVPKRRAAWRLEGCCSAAGGA